MKLLRQNDIHFSPVSAFDDSGRVFFYKGRVFRAIYDLQKAKFYQSLLEQPWIDKVFEDGLVKTWICKEITIDNAILILEHQKISFDTHPCEWTNQMFWSAAQMMIKVNQQLAQYNYFLKDSHPWNIMFDHGYPIFIDFGSIIEMNCISQSWIDEFIKYISTPIVLANSRFYELSNLYRKEHSIGFGLSLFDNKFLKRIVFRDLISLFNKYSGNPYSFFEGVSSWLQKKYPISSKVGNWKNYEQHHRSPMPLKPTEEKQIFVYEILSDVKPSTLLDCASNKGYYAEMAAGLGSAVVAFDCEEYCVDQCLDIAKQKKLNITPAVMNFKFPTPNYGTGLLGESSFYRFRSEVVLVLGLIHHLCIFQGLPVSVFCTICKLYATQGIILEFVEQDDVHVKNWNLSIPKDYTFKNISDLFSDKFPLMKLTTIKKQGIHRKIIYFYA